MIFKDGLSGPHGPAYAPTLRYQPSVGWQ